MERKQLSGAIRAILDEYQKAIEALIVVIAPLNRAQLTNLISQQSSDPESKSIQNILTHVISSCFSYSVYIQNWIGIPANRPETVFFEEVKPYIKQLRLGFKYCENVFIQNPNLPLEEFEYSKKIHTKWGQHYDVEQLLEHAIVHVLRHRRQIERIIGK